MTDLLILYIDSDFIYPVVASDHGTYEKYEHPDRSLRDFRLWLYFEIDQASSRIIPAKRARAGYLSGNPACRGDIFGFFDRGDNAQAEALLNESGLVTELKRLYSGSGVRPETDIPTAYVFAGNITERARRNFMAYMESRSFATLSFTVRLEDLAAATLAPGAKFGDRLLTYSSSGQDLVTLSYVCESDRFMLSDKPAIMKDSGYNPLREALVQYVVAKANRNGFLTSPEAIKAETEYQKQNVDEWMHDIDLNDPASVISFRFNNRANEYQIQVESDMLKNEQNKHIERLLGEMNSFRNRSAGSSDKPVSRVIFIGEMFADTDFRARAATSVGRGAEVSYLPVDDFASVLASYPLLYPELRQKLNEFEMVTRRDIDKVDGVKGFIDNADTLRAIAEEASGLAKDMEALAVHLKTAIDNSLSGVEQMLCKSNFNGADEALDHASIPEADSPLFTRQRALGTVISQNRKLLTNPNAKGIAEQIDALCQAILTWRKAIDEELQRAGDLRTEIKRLREVYPEYQQLIGEFEGADVSRKRDIVDEIKNRRLTRETLPVTGLTSPFLAKIVATVNKTGGFLGFGVKKSLSVSVITEDGYRTECKTVVIVQDKPLVTISRANIRHTIEAGFNGRVDLAPIALPLDGSKAKRIYIYLKPDIDQAISINDPYMTVKSVEIDI